MTSQTYAHHTESTEYTLESSLILFYKNNHMQSFIVPVSFQFNGVVEVQAESLEDAKRDIEKYMHATQNIQNDQKYPNWSEKYHWL